jgi:hypothetical protein
VERGSEQKLKADSSMRSKDVWQSAYAEGGQEASDCWKQVSNKRTPIGTFFGLGNPALPRKMEVQDKVPNMRPVSLTEVRLSNKPAALLPSALQLW